MKVGQASPLNKFSFEERGEIDIKGKGGMRNYFLIWNEELFFDRIKRNFLIIILLEVKSFMSEVKSYTYEVIIFSYKVVTFSPEAVAFSPEAVAFSYKVVTFSYKAVTFMSEAVSI